jgi:hypothetical protein
VSESALHKAIVAGLIKAAPAGCTEVLFEFSLEGDTLELTAVPEEAARALDDAFTQAVMDLIAWLEREGERFSSGRYRVLIAESSTFEASFAFRAP